MITLQAHLKNFRRLNNKDFITNVQTRRLEYIDILRVFDEFQENSDLIFITNIGENSSEIRVTPSGNYTIKCYEKLENNLKEVIDHELIHVLDSVQRQNYINPVIAEVTRCHKNINGFVLEKEFETIRQELSERLLSFITVLKDSFLNVSINPNKQENTSVVNKIKWLGKTNVLATLFYELWKGQEKGKDKLTTPLFDADKKDIEALLLNNFIDSKGKPLSPNTISDYLNESKPLTRAKKGIRIEFLN